MTATMSPLQATNLAHLVASCTPAWNQTFVSSGGTVRKLSRTGKPTGKIVPSAQIAMFLADAVPAFKVADPELQIRVITELSMMDSMDETGESDDSCIEEVDPWLVPLMKVFRWRSNGTVQRGFYHKALAKHIMDGGDPEDPSVVKELHPMEISDDTCLATALMGDSDIWISFEAKYRQAISDPNVRVTPKTVKDGVRYYHTFRGYLKLMQTAWQSDIRFHVANEPGTVSNKPENWSFWHFGPYTHPCLSEPPGPTPTWDGWLAKLGHQDRSKVFMAWIMGVCLSRSKSRQILWLEGRGGDGKGTIASVLMRFLGERGAFPLSEDIFTTTHGSSMIYGYRLLVHPDCKNPRFLSYALVHQITGGDRVLINPKFGKAFQERMDTRVMVLANCPPDMDVYNLHESSRMVYLYINPNAHGADRTHLAMGKSGVQLKGDPTFEARLLEEMPRFLAKCAPAYMELCPTNGNIVLPDTVVNDVADRCASIEQERFEKFYDDNFEEDTEAWVESHIVKEAFDRIMQQGSRGGMAYQAFIKFIESKGHRKIRPTVADGTRVRGFLNMKPKGTSGNKLSAVRMSYTQVGLTTPTGDEWNESAPKAEANTGS